MAFHRFKQLPIELRLQIWECALEESLIANSLPTDEQKPVCRMTSTQSSETKLVTLEDLTLGRLGCVCRESRDVLRRCDRLNIARDYIATTDVVYIDDYDEWVAVDRSSLLKVRYIALSAAFCYDMLTIRGPSPTTFNQLGWPYGARKRFSTSTNSGFFSYVLICCPEIESITVVLPPLEKHMRFYADPITPAMRPSFLRVVPYSEIHRIRTGGPYTYTSWLRGSANAKRLFLGPFIKDINDVWGKDVKRQFGDVDHRRAITVQAGVIQYLEGLFKGKRRLSSIYKKAVEMEEEGQPADQAEEIP